MSNSKINRGNQISDELSRLMAQQSEFFLKDPSDHTWTDYEEFVESRNRIRELFAELEGLRKAA